MSKTNKRKSKNLKVQEEPIAAENIPIVFSWVTMDFIRKPLTEFYFTVAVFGSLAMTAWGIYDRNFIMVVTFIVMVIMIMLVINEEPKKVDIRITEAGIDINSEHYNFDEFQSFKISYADRLPALILKPRKNFSFFKTIYIEKEPVNDLESFLGIFLEKEEEIKEA